MKQFCRAIAWAALASTTAQAADYIGGMAPVSDNAAFTHGLFEQLETRIAGSDAQFRYDGQLWSGTDTDRLWIKSEGLLDNSRFTDGQHDLLYDRAVSTYFDLQGGLRVDLDRNATRSWAAFGVQGLAAYFFDVEATFYVSDRGRLAARLKASYDLPVTNRLILQPEAEANLYTRSDAQRGIGAGVSDIDAGLRLRYEFSRKLAPYIGVSYAGRFGQAQNFARSAGERPQDVRLTIGLRTWF